MADRTIEWDSELRGFGIVTMTASGRESFVYQWRDWRGSYRMKLTGRFLQYEIEREQKAGNKSKLAPAQAGRFSRKDAKREAEVIRGAIARGRNPLKELRVSESLAANTLQSVAETFFNQPDTKKLRTAEQQKKTLQRLVFPRLGKRPIDEIERADVRNLFKVIAHERGPVMADRTASYLGPVFNWWKTHSDHFESPMVRGLRFSDPKERMRDRVLTDAEIRRVWETSEAWQLKWRDTAFPGRAVFGSLIQFLLLTGARRTEGAGMRRAEIDTEGNWICPAARHKSKRDFLLPLPARALAVVAAASEPIKDGLVFTSDGKRTMGGYAKFKTEFDRASGISNWTIHDLRRTARTLMTRAGISEEYAERTIAHAQRSIVKNYNVWQYRDEKAEAMRKLSGLFDLIIKPPKGNVVNWPTKDAAGA